METARAIRADVLRKRMSERNIRVYDLARESGMYATDVSAILSGGVRMGPLREAKLARGIIRLGLDKEQPEPTPPAAPVVIRITRLG